MDSIAEVRRDRGPARIVHLGLPGLKGRLDRIADWVKLTDDGPKPARPPRDVIEDMEALPKLLPVLRGVIGTPTFAPDGTLVTHVGYQPSTGLYYEPSGEPVPCVPDRPDATDLKRAKQLIGQEWLADFPFAEDASRANAMAAPITAITREMIDGPTPLFAIDAPAAGTGKGLLTAGIGIITSGTVPGVMTEARNEEELRKRITALLLAGSPIGLFDNIKRRLESGTLAALLTATIWSDRLLGKTQTIELPNRAVWLATGNNLHMGDEIARRAVWIRLDAKVDRPWERTSFRHENLSGWLQRHRHELVWAFLILIQNWLARGRPAWDGKPLGSYEGWSSVVGGTLQAAGIAGFLANREELYRHADAETEEWRSFCHAWWDEHGVEPVKAAQLLTQGLDLLPSVFERVREGASDRSLRTRLGKALAERRDRRFDHVFIRRAGEDEHSKGALWHLETAKADKTADVAQVAASTYAQHPHAIRSDSDSNADDGRKMPSEHPQDVPRCHQCGMRMSVVSVSDICGGCQREG